MKKYIFLIIAISAAIFFFKATTSYRMPPDYNYDSDFGRDLWMTEKITQGKFTLVGPQFSFAGLRLAPYHFYLFAPALALFNSYKAVVYVNGLLFIASLVLTFIILKQNYGRLYSFLATVWIMTTPFIILSARSPGNAFTYLAFYLVYLTYFFTAKSRGTFMTFVMGAMAGVMVNYHPVNFLVVLVPFLTKEIFVHDRFTKNIFLSQLLYFSSFILTFVPVIVFELKHNFVLMKSFFGPAQADFITGAYLKTVGTLSHMVELNDLSFTWIPVTGLGLFAIIVMSYFEKRNSKMKSWFVSVIMITALFLVFGRTIAHYFFPTILFLQLMLIFFVKEIKRSKLVMVSLIAVNLVFFPARFYKNARNLGQTEKNFNSVIHKISLPKSGINTLLVNQTRLSAPGYEYRYLLTKNGYAVDDEYSYSSSENLLLVSESGEIDWKRISNWEMSQFGNKKLKSKAVAGKNAYYLFSKISP